MPAMDENVRCPHCLESVRADALTCGYCGANLAQGDEAGMLWAKIGRLAMLVAVAGVAVILVGWQASFR